MTGEFFIFSLVMKISLATLFLLFFPAAVFAQQLGQVTFSRSSSALSYFSFVTDQGVLIRVSPEGKILEWGTEVLSDRGNYFAPKLQPFMGKVDYYGAADDSVFQGKVKSIGTCFITYYDSFQVKTKAGKVKMLGNQMLERTEQEIAKRSPVAGATS